MSKDEPIKAIETVYKGYRFRSRLEARWAVFFDALGINWQYEPEGFVSGTSRYLPDFHLPDYDCWIEIKGREPSKAEVTKVWKFAAALDNAWETGLKEAWAKSKAEHPLIEVVGDFTEQVTGAYGKILEQYLRKDLYASDPDYALAIDNMTKAVETLETFGEHLIHSLSDEPISEDVYFCIGSPWLDVAAGQFDYRLHRLMTHREGFSAYPLYWYACTDCDYTAMDSPERKPICIECGEETFSATATRLLDAYRAARGARFEYGETPQ